MSGNTQPTGPRYVELMSEIKLRVRQAQTRAMSAVNAELIRLYWGIGQLIDSKQDQEGWGSGVIPRLAQDIRNDLPEVKGFSERNIKRMLAFYREYPYLDTLSPTNLGTQQKVSQAVALLPTNLLLSLPWGHHAELMTKIKDIPTRQWYMESAVEYGWSRRTLTLQISHQAHQRQGRAVSNFSVRLPQPDSDMAQQTLKDPYIFDFLTLDPEFREKELEIGLVAHLETFLLELGQGFAFVGRQYHIDLEDQDFYIDLLFYHLKLRSYVVIELKRGDFKPEYAGKMNFYCSVVDDQLRHASDNPTIGLILCQQPSRLVAEYALRGMQQPIGVSGFELTRALPDELKSSLPSIEELERELHDGNT